MSNYVHDLSEAAENQDDINIPNSSFDHALQGVYYLFQNAKDGSTIRIITGEFIEYFWNIFLEPIKLFLNNHGKIEVILTDKKKSTILSGLKKAHANLILGYFASSKVITPFRFNFIPHFVVIEPVGYRIELIDGENEGIYKAILNFGNKTVTDDYIEFFNQIKSQSTNIL